ncbi:MAG: dTDP-4-dehydrorhamnose reductase [Bacteroidales bacterium]|nr:dTDP-4-dehydrorhamnose reductase [Bacteroidales bacterium]MCF8403961.1 dTDP-4-dehydrorhamnose reductase [Bacteroidales bacterium]
MKVLLTGSKGQLGLSIKNLESSYPHLSFIYTDIEELDITYKPELDKFIAQSKIDFLVNCAAYTAVDKAEVEKKKAALINATAVKHLAELSSKYNYKLIHISTDYVFSGTHFRPYIETDPTGPNGVYAETKKKAEDYVYKHSKNALILRTSWLYSEYGNNFVKTIQRLGLEREKLNIVADQVGTPTYAGDLAKAILYIINKPNQDGVEIYHFSNEGIASWYDFAREILEISKISCEVFPIKTEDYPLPAPRPFYSVLSKEKFTRKFYPIPHWKTSLRDCLQNIKKIN